VPIEIEPFGHERTITCLPDGVIVEMLPESFGFALTSPPESMRHISENSRATHLRKPSNAAFTMKLRFEMKATIPSSLIRFDAQRKKRVYMSYTEFLFCAVPSLM
jgi:hypothetical protein